jgi:hypothetical protein
MGPGSRPGRRGYGFAISRRVAPEVCWKLPALENRGRREDRVLAAPAVSRANCAKQTAHEHTGSAETLRPSLRNGFTAYNAISPVGPCSLSPSPVEAIASHELDASIRGVRTTRLCRTLKPRSSVATLASIASPSHVRDDRERPSERDGMAILVPLICPSGKAKYFLFQDLTRFPKIGSDLSVEPDCRTPTVIASEAKQSISPRKERMDCFVAEPVIGRAFARPVGSSQ